MRNSASISPANFRFHSGFCASYFAGTSSYRRRVSRSLPSADERMRPLLPHLDRQVFQYFGVLGVARDLHQFALTDAGALRYQFGGQRVQVPFLVGLWGVAAQQRAAPAPASASTHPATIKSLDRIGVSPLHAYRLGFRFAMLPAAACGTKRNIAASKK